jgi:arylsulfatase
MAKRESKGGQAEGGQPKPNILVIWGDDIGTSNLSCYSHGLMGTGRRTSTASPAKA